jgi:hypothetical protein
MASNTLDDFSAASPEARAPSVAACRSIEKDQLESLNGFDAPGPIFFVGRSRVARWRIFKPKIPNWVYFGGFCNKRFWGIYGHLVYFTVIWSMFRSFGLFYGHLVYFPDFVMLYQEKSGSPGAELKLRILELCNVSFLK